MEVKRVIAVAAGAVGVIALALFGWVWLAPCWLGGCAPVGELAEYQAEGSVLLDIDEEPIGTLATVNRSLVSIDSLPPHLIQAFLAVEDQRFYDHGGVDFRRLIGALVRNVRAGGVEEGGSTITQQLARNLFPEWLPYRERSVRRKIMEARVARQIERNFPKDKILELYVNHIYLGEGAYGVEAASRRYFGKPAAELTISEAALIGGLPKAPSQLNPVQDLEAAQERRNLVLTEMAEAGYISDQEASEAKEQEIRLARADPADGEAMRGSYFIERVRREMEQVIGSRFYTAGLKIHTTMDSKAQSAAESELARQLDALEAGAFGPYRHETYPEAKGVAAETGDTPYVQGAVVVMDARDGEVRALVGGRDFDDSKFDRAMQARRQAGSAFKPFVYLAALERFGSPVRIVEDAPVRLAMSGGRVWEPRNYTGRYDGPITMREAITRSKNAATVDLAQEIGIGTIASKARQLGITTDIPEVPATALGAAAVRPIEMVQAYAAFSNGGNLVEPHFIRRVVDRHGRVVWESRPRTDRVLDPAPAFVLTTMLQDVVSRGTGTAARAGYGGAAAGKTGTTNDAADVWFIGYTPELVGGIWIGMDDPKTVVPGASGGTIAAPIWGRMMGRIYEGRTRPNGWNRPSGVETAEVERATGMVVGEGCPARGPTYTEYFVGRSPISACRLDGRYPSMARYDSLWVDEEWGAGMEYDSARDLESAGIEWPELEEIRRRVREGAAGLDTAAPQPRSGEEEPEPETESPTRREESRPEPAPAPRPREGRRERPPLLGVPVTEDTTGVRNFISPEE